MLYQISIHCEQKTLIEFYTVDRCQTPYNNLTKNGMSLSLSVRRWIESDLHMEACLWRSLSVLFIQWANPPTTTVLLKGFDFWSKSLPWELLQMFTKHQIILLIQEHFVKHLIFYHFQICLCILIHYMGIKYLLILSLSLWVICSWVLIAGIHGEIFLNLIHTFNDIKINTSIANSYEGFSNILSHLYSFFFL